MKTFIAAAAAAGLAMAGAAHADGFSYTHIGLGTGSVKGSTGDESDKGMALRLDGAFEFSPHVFGFADVVGTIYERYDPGLDEDVESGFTIMSLGAGFDWPLAPTVDLVTGISLDSVSLDNKVNGVTTTVDFDGWGLNLGLRGRVGERWQWQAAMRYGDVEDLGSTTSLTAGGRYYINAQWAVGLEVAVRQYDEDTLDLRETSGLLNIRYEFADRH